MTVDRNAAQEPDQQRGSSVRSLFRVPRNGHELINFAIPWAVILGLATAFGWGAISALIGQ
jgi:hypothetical protein